LWEFPGGKVEDAETVLEALSRELKEELAISVLDAEPFLEVRHDYSEKSVLLDVWEVTRFSGCAVGNEGQPIAWISVDQLIGYQFPEANGTIIDALQKWASET
jgi:8-oxo-dGTP diphosphatase